MNGGRQGYQKSDLGLPWQHEMKARQVEARLPEAQVPFPLRSGEGVGNIIGTAFAEVLAGCGAFEWVALGYLVISSVLIVIFSENLGHPLRLLSVQALGALVHMVLPRWQDAKLIAFDHWLTGVHPAIWLEQFATTGRNEFMQFAYLTYFVYLLVLGGILYYREDWHGYWSVMTYSAVAYAIGYVIAIFFPIESPWFAMAGSWHGELHGGPFTALINFIEHYGRVRGAAFPSEHVAGSFAALWGAWRHRRWLFWVMLPLVLCMCVSTVWGRYHYVVDIFGGIVTGTLGYVIGKWIMKTQEKICGRVLRVERAESLVRH